jgi:predicted secreted protein
LKKYLDEAVKYMEERQQTLEQACTASARKVVEHQSNDHAIHQKLLEGAALELAE